MLSLDYLEKNYFALDSLEQVVNNLIIATAKNELIFCAGKISNLSRAQGEVSFTVQPRYMCLVSLEGNKPILSGVAKQFPVVSDSSVVPVENHLLQYISKDTLQDFYFLSESSFAEIRNYVP